MRIARSNCRRQAARIMTLLLACTLLLALGGCQETAGTVMSGSTAEAAATSAAGSTMKTASGRTPEYAEKIFGRDIISIDIIANDAEWRTMLDTAIQENYIKVDVVVNGTRFYNVGIRPKGNSSLKEVANSNSDRFSFRLKFDEYVKDQTCFGLDTFVVNNMLGDYTYMKEYFSYDLMRTIGVKAPYFGFASISLNGSPWGLYLAVEAYNDSYLKRTFGSTGGKLYNVKMVGGAGVVPPDGTVPPGGAVPPDGFAPPDGNSLPGGQMPNGVPSDRKAPGGFAPPGGNIQPGGAFPPGDQMPGRGPMGAASSGGSLQYTNDDPDSYKAIFDNAVGKSTAADHLRVIAALKILSATDTTATAKAGELERAFDVDAILRYFAAHTLVVNLDSYSSMMAQNYYVHEQNGRVTILPWDYNLAWGGFQNSSASSVINFPIDTPVSGIALSARPLLDKLLANDAYRDRYHQYLQQLIDNCFSGGRFAATVKRLDTLIADAVKKDPTAFCSFAEYEKAVAAFTTLGNLRAESVQGQLNGTVPGTTAGQAARPDQLVGGGSLNMRDLGTMGGNKGQNGKR